MVTGFAIPGRPAGAPFDAHLMVDWSAGSTPKQGADSIWIAHLHGKRLTLENPATRAEARDVVLALLRGHAAAGRRVLVGCDFPYGYPAGFAAALGLPGPGGGPPWRAVWDAIAARVADGPTNANNRFAAAAALNARASGRAYPFWGCPAAQAGPFLSPRKPPPGPLADLRAAERFAPGASSPWKCLYTGSVGGQALVGIPVVRAWRDDPALRDVSAVWPFETGFAASGAQIVHAEIYPSMLRLAGNAAMVRDARQVETLARAFAAAGARFGPPPGLDEADRRRAEAEEGWILVPCRS